MGDGEEQAVGRDRALQQLVRRARMRIAEFVVGITARADHILLEPRWHLIRRYDRAHFQAPGVVLERLGGRAGDRGAGAGSHGAGEHDAAAEKRAAIEQTVAGNLFEWLRCAVAALAKAHESLPGGWAAGCRSGASFIRDSPDDSQITNIHAFIARPGAGANAVGRSNGSHL